jgi:hypothetical protein
MRRWAGQRIDIDARNELASGRERRNVRLSRLNCGGFQHRFLDCI